MSLKARIEAVIYAAEEPVTLVQLAALFGDEALEQKQARDAAREAESSAIAEADADEAEEVIAFPADENDAEASQETAEAELSPEAVAQAAAAEEKRLARQRERDIRDELRTTIDELIAEYETSERGMEIREVAGGYRVGTKPEYHDSVSAFVKSLKPPIRLSLQALETLAVVAYKQPVTAPEISEIRGVDSSGVLGSLLGRKLINTAGRKQVIGRPILYKTTKEFLLRFGLKDLSELPSMEEFEKMAGELADTDAEEPAESENLPFARDENGDPVEKGSAEDSETKAAAVSAEELAYRAEHGSPGASTPATIEVTIESEMEIVEDLPGVKIGPEALEAEAAAETSVEEPTEK
jgi:segregation and condensation protein B